MIFKRTLDIRPILTERSCFLLGPRQTGKSHLIRAQLPEARVFNLLEQKTFALLSQDPSRIYTEARAGQIVVIDEIQKAPTLLDAVQIGIEEHGLRYLLTGSSARRLRKAGVNLLGGRARIRYFHPLTYGELEGAEPDFLRLVNFGTLPSIRLSSAPEEDLHSYAALYLTEEIAQEAATRNIPAFSRFLRTAALCNGQVLNLSAIGSDAQVATSTVQGYFQILSDTLIASSLETWRASRKRKAAAAPKLYFFDAGVARTLAQQPPAAEGSPSLGVAFETYLCHELRSYIDYHPPGTLTYWRELQGDREVDFILNESVAIEVKATTNVTARHLAGLKAIQDEGKMKRYLLVCREDHPRREGAIEILPWRVFLGMLWGGELGR